MAPRETENNAYAKFWGDKQRALWYVIMTMVFSGVVNYVSVKSKLQHTQVLDTFAVRWRREFDYQSLPGVGNLNCTLISSETSGVASYHGGHGVRGFMWKRLCLCDRLVARKGPKQALYLF